MEFHKVIRTRRSVRAYKNDSIPDETLKTVLEAARIAPSGSNRQPWKFIIVKDDELKNRLAEACGNQRFIGEAPVVVVACGYKIPYNRGGYMGEMGMVMDVSIAFTQLILAAWAEGLGTCWIGLFDNDEIKKMLNIPPEVNVVAVTPLGYPESEVQVDKYNRKPLTEITSHNRF
jgi:nitroreductase